MTTVNIHEAKTHLSRLIEVVNSGESVVIAKSGRPVAKLVQIEAPTAPSRLGFLSGRALVPDDFDSLGAAQISELFAEH